MQHDEYILIHAPICLPESMIPQIIFLVILDASIKKIAWIFIASDTKNSRFLVSGRKYNFFSCLKANRPKYLTLVTEKDMCSTISNYERCETSRCFQILTLFRAKHIFRIPRYLDYIISIQLDILTNHTHILDSSGITYSHMLLAYRYSEKILNVPL